ncbi:Malignant fibrous histiocytoma-amplified sequence 1-like [Durusdinium trenchii]|uniref:Malignant fibrous histiocytoma-amplified sequence 1-like n=1 Tax=Durusdinium trenchii TaxID=1381693 RepID=A0ABP0HCC1_9DINO
MCLVRMLSCGNRSLAERCGSLLAEWVDATAEELHDRIDSMSEALFRDLPGELSWERPTRRFQLVQGIKSVNERPMVWEPGKARRVGGAATPHSSSLRIEASWYILTALSKFGPSTLYERMVSPWRARVLRPFLPVLCREPKEVLGTRGCCRAVSARVCRGGGEWT